MARKHRKTFVAVDFDFFVYNGFYDKLRAKVPRSNPNEEERWETVPGALLFDWGHSEAHSAGLQTLLWHARMETFDRVGLRIEDVAAIRTDAGCTHPFKFAEEIDRRFEFECATLYSDSHAHGHEAVHLAALRSGPVDLLLFDAHHDLGYRSDTVQAESKQRVMSCGSWVYHTMKTGAVRNVRVVYPDWKGLREWPKIEKGSHLRTLRPRLSCTTWTEWCKETEGMPHEKAAGLHLARSGSWTPPYLDLAFNQLVERIGPKPLMCMDCDPAFAKIGPWDACKERQWFRRIDERAA